MVRSHWSTQPLETQAFQDVLSSLSDLLKSAELAPQNVAKSIDNPQFSKIEPNTKNNVPEAIP
jgi:hypothetical protein